MSVVFIQSFNTYSDETDPDRVQQIISRAVEDAEWVIKKVSCSINVGLTLILSVESASFYRSLTSLNITILSVHFSETFSCTCTLLTSLPFSWWRSIVVRPPVLAGELS